MVTLLEQAKAELQAGGPFPFSLPPGFTGFNTPATFLAFNRALRARVAVYRNDYAGALTALSESFLDPRRPSSILACTWTTAPAPATWPIPLSLDPQQGENFAHPSLETGAQLQADGVTLDQRFVDKIVTAHRSPAPTDLTSDLGWIRYPSPDTRPSRSSRTRS